MSARDFCSYRKIILFLDLMKKEGLLCTKNILPTLCQSILINAFVLAINGGNVLCRSDIGAEFRRTLRDVAM